MSYIINNVECTGCDFFEFEAMYKRADGPDNCPQCGSKRKMSFKGFTFAIHGQGYGSFAPVDFGVMGKAETKEDYERCVAAIQEKFPGKRVEISHESASAKQMRLDELRHRSHVQRKSHGLDKKMSKEITEYTKVRKSELRAQGKLNVKIPSAAEMAQGKDV